MYYIGSHWGLEHDGYICSSNRMRNAYRRRPDDFKRKIIEKTDERSLLLGLEEKWLQLAENKKERYYNLVFTTHNNYWWNEENSRLTVGQKISKSHKSNPNMGKWAKGKVLSEETKKKISISTSKAMKKYYKENPRTDETRKKISENTKRLHKEKKIGTYGTKHSQETLKKMSENNAMNNPIHRAKVKASKQGIKWLKNGETRKMAVPGTDKYEMLLQSGFEVM